MKQNRRRERGFTMMELVVVIIIIGVLAALVAPKFFGKVSEAKLKAAKAQIELFGTALDALRLDVGRYPTTEEGSEGPPGKTVWNGNLERPLPPQRNPHRPLGKTLYLQIARGITGITTSSPMASTVPREGKGKAKTWSAGKT